MSGAGSITDYTLTEVAVGIKKKKFSSEEVTKECLNLVHQAQPKLNCFISIDAEAAIESARKADRGLASGNKLGMLHGVPLAHKDMFYKKGLKSTGGSKIQKDFIPSYTATVISRLEAAGAISLGGLNMSEFASGPVGQNLHFGDCKNPCLLYTSPSPRD